MLEELVQELFESTGHVWNISGRLRTPEATDIRRVLDEAAGVLYDSPVGTQMQTGGLIIEKTHQGFDVHVYVGNFE